MGTTVYLDPVWNDNNNQSINEELSSVPKSFKQAV